MFRIGPWIGVATLWLGLACAGGGGDPYGQDGAWGPGWQGDPQGGPPPGGQWAGGPQQGGWQGGPQQGGWQGGPQQGGWQGGPQQGGQGGWQGGPQQGGWQGGPPPGGQGGWQGGPPPGGQGGWQGDPQQGGWQGGPPPGGQGGWQGGPPPGGGDFVPGRDYLVLERVRFQDTQGFDRPVEAFSALFPRGWKVEGGVQWRGINACRGEMITQEIRASSPDGAMLIQVFPVRAFQWAEDPQLLQLLQVGAQSGGCTINQPFEATQYIEGFARQALGATASNLRPDVPMTQQFQNNAQQLAAQARQSGMDQQITGGVAFGDLAWPDGSQGLMHVGVMNTLLRKPDYMTGGSSLITNSMVYYAVLVRYPAGRADEAHRLLATARTSHRVNPVWKEATDRFQMQLSQTEHKGNMERIRLMGEQSQAYAKAQGEASDARMRSWEAQQSSQNAQQRAYIQTIREVETWQDASGPVELSAGYQQAWSRGDGTYVLSNKPGFDPAFVLQDQGWQPMRR